MAAVTIRGTSYPLLLPKLRDPRLHLAATITSLQVIGQIGFHFTLSIAQILVSLATCAVLEVGIAFRRQRVILWPASALLTGNGVAFVLRVPGTQHGDWWSLRGWWIYAATAAVSLLSKHVITWRGEHPFNPSNLGLVICFLALGRNRADPLDFWWGPTSPWLVLALAVILAGGFTILSRLHLLWIALAFWGAFAAGIGVLAATGHAMVARWHLGPVSGLHFWWTLVTSPEVLVFLFFMITDPKTAPRGARARIVYAVSLGLLAPLLIALTTSEFAAKVALLGALAIVCAAMPLLRPVRLAAFRRAALAAAAVTIAAYAGAVAFTGGSAAATSARAVPAGTLPPIEILPSRGVQTALDRHTADLIAHDLLGATNVSAMQTLTLRLAPGKGQAPPYAVAASGGRSYELEQAGNHWQLRGTAAPKQLVGKLPAAPAARGFQLQDVAAQVGLDFQQDSFRFGMWSEPTAMMGGGVCFLDYNGDGFVDLFAVNSYASSDAAQFEAQGGLPRSALYRNEHGRFVDVTAAAHAGLPVQGDGCVAGDLNGDGRPDLVVTTTTGIDLLWNDGRGGFTRSTLPAAGWYTGAAIADVNGDGLPDLFVAGYTDPNDPVANSFAGFPTNLVAVRDLLYLNEGDGAGGRARLREVGIPAGLESSLPRHGLGATFLDYNRDGRPDLYVANDEDPNQLYENVPWPGGVAADPAHLGFRFEERGAAEGVADPYAGMGIATGNGRLFVTNSRNEPSAAYQRRANSGAPAYVGNRSDFAPALGAGFAGWGVSFVDLANTGSPDLVLAAGAIPVTNLSADAEPLRVLGPRSDGTYGDLTRILGPKPLRVNGRGLAAADISNDGRMSIAVNTIGGRLVLLRPSGPSGHWLDVRLTRFSPGALVSVVLPGGRRLEQEVQAGGSYLSSSDPRVHFGLGSADRVLSLTVHYPFGGVTRLDGVAADQIVRVPAPLPPAPQAAPPRASIIGCTPAAHGESVARAWNRTAVEVLREARLPEPVQARDLFHLAAAMRDAWAAYAPGTRGYFVTAKAHAADTLAARGTAISYAAYRLLVWRVSFGANLDRTFATLKRELGRYCGAPSFVSTAGASAAALGNRIAAAAIAAGAHDGSLEPLHYVDSGYVPQNGPLVVAQPGSTVRDATFWQPLARAQVAAHGAGFVPADVQSFVGSQWGRVRGFGAVAVPQVASSPLPEAAAYKHAALAVIRATASASRASRLDATPLGWNVLADRLPSSGSAAARLDRDIAVSFVLNAALFDASIATWGAKRAAQAPRPISMIRYLAFQGQSSDAKRPSYSAAGLPLVPGLVELSDGRIRVREGGRWVAGTRWTAPAATPASPGAVSEDAAFAAAARTALAAVTGRSFAAAAAARETLGLTQGIDLPSDVAAGRTVGRRAAERAVALARAYQARRD